MLNLWVDYRLDGRGRPLLRLTFRKRCEEQSRTTHKLLHTDLKLAWLGDIEGCNIRTSVKQGLWVLFQILTNWLGNYSSLWVSFCPSGNLPSCQNCCKALTKGELQSRAVGVCPLVFSLMCSHACDIFFPQLHRLLASSTPAIRKGG